MNVKPNPTRDGTTPGGGTGPTSVGRVPSPGRAGVAADQEPENPPRRLRRLQRVWPDRDGNISYLLTLCVEGRARVLANDEIFQRLGAFLLNSPARYDWCPRRFVVMPDHLHLIAHQGHEAVRLGQWVKALKAVVGGLKPRSGEAGSGDPAYNGAGSGDPVVGRLPPAGDAGNAGSGDPAYRGGSNRDDKHPFTRVKRSWCWQEGFHDHKFRTPESEQRKWEYVCLNPVRYGLVERPEQWPYGGEIFYEDVDGPRLVLGTPPLLEVGILMERIIPPPPVESGAFRRRVLERFGVAAIGHQLRDPRGQLEQQRQQLPDGEPQQQQPGQSEQQRGFPSCPAPSSTRAAAGAWADPVAIPSGTVAQRRQTTGQSPPGESARLEGPGRNLPAACSCAPPSRGRGAFLPESVNLGSNVWTNGFRVVVQGEAGRRYDIEVSETPAVPGSWVAVATNLDGAGVVDFTDLLAAGRAARFYRVIER